MSAVSPATAFVTAVADSASVQTLCAARTDPTTGTYRTGLSIWNDSTSTLYVKLGSAATSTDCTVKLTSDAYWEMPVTDNRVYQGIVTGIWSADSTGSARVTEYV